MITARLRFAVLVLCAVGVAVGRAETPTWTGDPARGREELERQWPQIEHPAPTVGIRGVFRFALEAAGLGWHPERVAAALDLARSMQDLDPASKTHGNFQWRRDQVGVLDRNAVEFSMQQAALLRKKYYDFLTPAGRAQLDAIVADAIDGMARHTVPQAYTNIHVMQAWNRLALGEATGRAELAAAGRAQFLAWVHYVAQYGISEYGAITYYGVDLDSLALIAKFSDDAPTRAAAEAMQRYIWTDLAANWWAPGDRIGGTNARSYDYLFAHGYTEAHTWAAGWLRTRPELEGAGWLSGPATARANQSTLYDACRWVPPAALVDPIRAQLPRLVAQRWGAEPGQRAVQWVGRHVSLASSGASHGADERTLVANLGDSPAVPQLVLFMDGRGDPFGTKKIANAANQAKALHLTPFIAAVQRGPEVLQLLSDEPLGKKSKRKPGELACFLTQLTLPATAEVWIGDALAQPGSPEQPVAVPAGAPVYVKLGDAAIGVRFLLTTATAGGVAPVQFIEDQAGGPARRLTVVHEAREPHGRGTVAVYLRAAEGLDAAGFAAFRKTFAAVPVQVQFADNVAHLAAGALRIEADVVKGERRKLEGGEPEALLSVNGRDLGREILKGY